LQLAAAICAVLFVPLAFAAHHAGNLLLDHRIDSVLFRAQGTRGHGVATAATFFGSAPGVAAVGILVALWLVTRRRPAVALMVLASPVIGAAAEILVKKAVDRYQEPTGVSDHFRNQHFPSGHVTGYTALALAIVLAASLPELGGMRSRLVPLSLTAFAGAVLVSISRVVLGAHFFTDTVGGFLLGTGVSCAVAAVLIAFRPTERYRALRQRVSRADRR
jgi:undecaprenyl-diphosphatase